MTFDELHNIKLYFLDSDTAEILVGQFDADLAQMGGNPHYAKIYAHIENNSEISSLMFTYGKKFCEKIDRYIDLNFDDKRYLIEYIGAKCNILTSNNPSTLFEKNYLIFTSKENAQKLAIGHSIPSLIEYYTNEADTMQKEFMLMLDLISTLEQRKKDYAV